MSLSFLRENYNLYNEKYKFIKGDFNMLDLGGMMMMIGGLTLAVTMVMAIVEFTESNKRINRRLHRIENFMERYTIED